MKTLSTLQDEVIALSKKVGDFILEESKNFDKEAIELKGLNDLVSYVDKTAEAQLVAGLGEILPEAGFIAEEGTSTKVGDLYQWIVDPVDGTTNFTHGLPIFAVSIALMRGKEIVLGVIYEVNRKECFYAVKGSKAYCNGKEIRVSSVERLEESLLATGFPYYNFEKMDRYLRILNGFMQGTHGLRRMGSAAVDLAYVACGRFEGFFEYNLKPWDVAAGVLIVQCAGGKVTDFKGGNEAVFGKEIVAACDIHPHMQQKIDAVWNDR